MILHTMTTMIARLWLSLIVFAPLPTAGLHRPVLHQVPLETRRRRTRGAVRRSAYCALCKHRLRIYGERHDARSAPQVPCAGAHVPVPMQFIQNLLDGCNELASDVLGFESPLLYSEKVSSAEAHASMVQL